MDTQNTAEMSQGIHCILESDFISHLMTAGQLVLPKNDTDARTSNNTLENIAK